MLRLKSSHDRFDARDSGRIAGNSREDLIRVATSHNFGHNSRYLIVRSDHSKHVGMVYPGSQDVKGRPRLPVGAHKT